MSSQNHNYPEAITQVFLDIRSHLGAGTPSYVQFLTSMNQFLSNYGEPCDHVDHAILNLAKLLKTHPTAFYKLNQIFHPHARVEFDIRQSPITSFVLKTSDSSRIMLLDPCHYRLPFHNLSTAQLRDILIHRRSANCTYDSLHTVADPALQDCLAQLAQDLLDDTVASKLCRKEALTLLRRPTGVPPSLLLHGLIQLDVFTYTFCSDLYEGTLGGMKVVIKKPRACKIENSEIIREIILCRQIRHPNVLPFLGVNFDGQNRLYGLVTPLMKNGNVIEFLKQHPGIDRLIPMWQITKGLEFLHNYDPPVAHRDIKGANVLVDDNFVCCLSDFGLSSIPELSQRSRDRVVGTLCWMAPEILLPPPERVDLFKVDVFALGITFIEIYAGKPPSVVNELVARYNAKILSKEDPSLALARAYSLPPYLYELLSRMLDHNPSKRPSTRICCQALEDNFVFPRTIEIDGDDQESCYKSEAVGHDDDLAKSIAQQWVRKEQESRSITVTESKCVQPHRISVPRSRADSLSSHDRSSSRVDLLRRTATRFARPTSALSGYESAHGLPTPFLDYSRSSPAVAMALPSRKSQLPTPPKSTTPNPLTRPDTPRFITKPPQPRATCPAPTLLTQGQPRERTPLTIPRTTPHQLATTATLSQFAHCDSEDPPASPSSPSASKRSHWSFSGDEGDDERENIAPSLAQKFCEGQRMKDLRSPSPSKRRRHDSCCPSPIGISSRVIESGTSSH